MNNQKLLRQDLSTQTCHNNYFFVISFREKKEKKVSKKTLSYQSDFHWQSFVSSSTPLQLLKGFSFVGNRRMIVLVRTGRVSQTTSEARVRAPVRQTVTSSNVIDSKWWAGGDVKAGEFLQVFIVLWRRARKVVLLFPNSFICLPGKTKKKKSFIKFVKCSL